MVAECFLNIDSIVLFQEITKLEGHLSSVIPVSEILFHSDLRSLSSCPLRLVLMLV